MPLHTVYTFFPLHCWTKYRTSSGKTFPGQKWNWCRKPLILTSICAERCGWVMSVEFEHTEGWEWVVIDEVERAERWEWVVIDEVKKRFRGLLIRGFLVSCSLWITKNGFKLHSRVFVSSGRQKHFPWQKLCSSRNRWMCLFFVLLPTDPVSWTKTSLTV
jgi:hypothetical protein